MKKALRWIFGLLLSFAAAVALSFASDFTGAIICGVLPWANGLPAIGTWAVTAMVCQLMAFGLNHTKSTWMPPYLLIAGISVMEAYWHPNDAVRNIAVTLVSLIAIFWLAALERAMAERKRTERYADAERAAAIRNSWGGRN